MNQERNQEQINQEYTQAVARLGEIDFLTEKSFPFEREELLSKVIKLRKEADLLGKRMQELRAKEALEKAALEAKLAKEESAVKPAEPEEIPVT